MLFVLGLTHAHLLASVCKVGNVSLSLARTIDDVASKNTASLAYTGSRFHVQS